MTRQNSCHAALISILLTMGPMESQASVKTETWRNCLYNNERIACRRTFLCSRAPCDRFKLEWEDGPSDIYTLYKDGVARGVGYYKDTRGGRWQLNSFTWSFGLENLKNGNTIIYRMTLPECKKSMLADLC